jgi:hypothetical protein
VGSNFLGDATSWLGTLGSFGGGDDWLVGARVVGCGRDSSVGGALWALMIGWGSDWLVVGATGWLWARLAGCGCYWLLVGATG